MEFKTTHKNPFTGLKLPQTTALLAPWCWSKMSWKNAKSLNSDKRLTTQKIILWTTVTWLIKVSRIWLTSMSLTTRRSYGIFIRGIRGMIFVHMLGLHYWLLIRLKIWTTSTLLRSYLRTIKRLVMLERTIMMLWNQCRLILMRFQRTPTNRWSWTKSGRELLSPESQVLVKLNQLSSAWHT